HHLTTWPCSCACCRRHRPDWFPAAAGRSSSPSRTAGRGTRPMSLQFRTAVHSGTTIIWYDVTPWNNIARLPFGTPAAPVPAGTPAAWLLLVVLLAWLARRQLRDTRRQ